MITLNTTHQRYIFICLSFFLLSFQLSFFDYTMNMDFLHYDDKMSNVYLFTVAVGIGWLFKFIPAVLSDLREARGKKRKSIILVAYVCTFVPLLVLSAQVETIDAYITFLVFYVTFLSIADVNMDAYIVQECKADENAGTVLFTLTTLAREMGYILGDSTGPLAWKYLGSKHTYDVLACSIFLSVFVAAVYPERERPQRLYSDEARAQYEFKSLSVWGVVKRIFNEYKTTPLRYLLLHLYLTALFPNARIAMFYYLTGPMGFTPEKMSALSISIGFIRLVFIIAYIFIGKLNIRTTYIICGGTALICSFAPLLLSIRFDVDDIQAFYGDEGFTHISNSSLVKGATFSLAEVYGLNTFSIAIIDDGVGSILESFRGATVFRLVSLLSEPVVEASALAIALSILNGMYAIQRIISASILRSLDIRYNNFTNLTFLLLICCGAEFVTYISGDFVAPDSTIKEIADKEPIDVIRKRIMEKRQERLMLKKKLS